jgi:hypothetical protein
MGETLFGKHCLFCESFLRTTIDVGDLSGTCKKNKGKDGSVKGEDVCELWESGSVKMYIDDV